jgi:hypothetical protein
MTVLTAHPSSLEDGFISASFTDKCIFPFVQITFPTFASEKNIGKKSDRSAKSRYIKKKIKYGNKVQLGKGTQT